MATGIRQTWPSVGSYLMADESASEERTEEPTAKRLEKAREDGQVALSLIHI